MYGGFPNLFEGEGFKMKRKVFLALGVLLASGFVLLSCTAQSPKDAQQVVETTQQFVGTWRDISSSSTNPQWVFNTDGTGRRTWETSDYGRQVTNTRELVYAVPVSGKAVIYVAEESGYSYEYYFADNGETLILYAPGANRGKILKKIVEDSL
jgi:hypothetical protein